MSTPVPLADGRDQVLAEGALEIVRRVEPPVAAGSAVVDVMVVSTLAAKRGTLDGLVMR